MLRVLLGNPPPPQEAHRRLSARFGTTFVLESRDGPARLARYSFVGWSPAAVVRDGAQGLIVEGDAPRPTSGERTLDYLRRLLSIHATTDRTQPFAGGLVGQVGYGFVQALEPSLKMPASEGELLILGLYLDCIVYDHAEGTCTYVSRGLDRRADLAVLSAPSKPRAPALAVGPLAGHPARAAFIGQVRSAQDLVAAGECFQIVLSRAYEGRYAGDLAECYALLRDTSRVPYLYHLRFAASGGRPPHALLGASPEMLVRVRGDALETVPIAGTRPFTGDAALDDAAAASLVADPKERAEHAMLVDLARNDVGRVSRPGSVTVDEYAQVAAFGPVQHLVSRVSARLAEGKDALDALAAIFPAGTVSGAPKLRAVEHISSLEGVARGAYAGCVLYASFNGDLDSAITIRSLEATGGDDGGTLVVRAGAGIVAGSDPAAEFEETRRKASTILIALQRFGATLPDEAAAPSRGPEGRPETAAASGGRAP